VTEDTEDSQLARELESPGLVATSDAKERNALSVSRATI
jgi:hypothetical protein